MAALARLKQRGGRAAVLTNSLATNDIIPAHAGYAPYRRALIQGGVELHELQLNAHTMKRQVRLFRGRSQASLHTKAMVLDRREIFIGSFNMDPRSLHLNTEMGYYVVSSSLGKQVAEFIEEGLSPQNSYRLELADDALSWGGVDEKGRPVLLNDEPGASLARRVLAVILSKLPIARFF